ncbi:glycosyltransferase family 4 protein [Comamonas thiooxydans]|uniref:glycosyltransferase family 4 protein n=1 Tax=Comamonas thiooxydans TaxID=363952 RepID=UPI002113E7C2|nr:glycosyltransferase family 1 protein [Comamonas thiooxydans]UUE95601.1 glycosyltransferase family 4 protein [Comamonas thiooxydans]
MRIVIDLQGAQCGSRHRGIGRYSLALAHAMVRNRGDHEIIIALSGLFPDTIEPIRAAFDGLLPQENIRVWHAPGPVHGFDPANNWRRHTAELIREAFLASLNPDIVHITSLIEGFGDNAVHSIGLSSPSIPCAVTFYDLIPLIQSEVYLDPNPAFEILYREKLDHLSRAVLYLAISESARLEVIEHLGATPEQTTNIAAATDDYFKPSNISKAVEKALRTKFGLMRPFVMYSGATDERKNHLRLIKAFSILPPEVRENHQLAIVGGLPKDHREKFETYIKLCGLKSTDVVITGRVSDKEMVDLYSLCALFVFPSWHEGFGLPALEAMSCGAPVIGSNTTSLPEVIGRSDALFDPFDEKAISKKMAEVLTDDRLREDLIRHGLDQCKKFSWDESAKCALAAFERWYAKQHRKTAKANRKLSNATPAPWLIESIAMLSNPPTDEHHWLLTAKDIALNHRQSAEKQLLVDISELVQRDAKTGIQRVVRSILAELLSNPPHGFRVEPVYASPGKPGYRYARQFVRKLLSNIRSDIGLGDQDEPVDVSGGDVFFGLDLHHVVLQQTDFYNHLKHIGVRTYYVVYDLAPIWLPKFFPIDIPSLHSQWLGTLAKADGVICISRAVADEMAEWLTVFGPERLRPLNLGWFHLGADVASSVPTKGFPADAGHVLLALSSRPTFLAVGTLEPRKGQMQTLLAFERLWDQGVDVNLVIVGKHGWNVSLLVEMLRAHSQLGKRLFWLEGISDDFLEQVYAASTCLLAASESEGFGLPLIEAAQHKLPIIARDIPVFREVAGDHAFYFSGLEPDALASAVREWLALDHCNQAPQSDNMPWLTWKQSTQNLLSVILGGQWYKQWMPDDVHRFWGGDARLCTQVGKRNGRDIETTGKAGYLIFGPYIPLEAGQYQVLVRGAVGACGLAGARMDVAVNKGAYILGESVLSVPDEKGNFVTLLINLDTPCTDLEVRLWVGGDSELKVSMIEIAPWHSGQQEILTNSEYATDSGTAEQPVKLVEMQEQAETQAFSALSHRLENNEVTLLATEGAVDAGPLIVNDHSVPVSADKTINSEKIAVIDANENLSPDLQLSQSGLIEISESKMLEIHTDKSKQSQSTSSVWHANKARRKKKR